MRRIDVLVAMGLCMCICACTPTDRTTSSPTPAQQEPAVVAAPPAATSGEDATPETPVAASEAASPAAARQVVIDYYAAIDAGEYAKAYALWSDQGAASGQTLEHFSGGYANTRSVRAVVGEPTDEEGAAGSRFIQVPVQLTALQRDGGQRRYDGRFTLRAVMADGASEDQRRWHLASAEMQRLTE